MYLVRNQVKKKIKQLGFRSDNGFLSLLDLTIEIIINRAADYTRPLKTMDRETMATYMQKHNIR